jgi:hypothetical protein
MNNLEAILERYPEDTFTLADGFDDAIVGVGEQFGLPHKIIYSVEKCIEVLINRDDMSMEEAQEFFYFNVKGAYVGKQTPIWLNDL